MVDAVSLILALDDKVDRLNTQYKQHVTIVSKCRALTEVQNLLTRKYARVHETDKENRNLLRQIEVKDYPMKPKKRGTTTLFEFPPGYYLDVGIRIVAVKRDCGTKQIGLTKMDSGDRSRSFNNPFWRSSYAWEQVFGDEARDGFFIDNGDDFKAEGMIIDYLIKPPDIHCPSLVKAPDEYIDWHGKKQTQDVGWTLDHLVDEGINRAALVLTRNVGDAADFELQQRNNAITEQ